MAGERRGALYEAVRPVLALLVGGRTDPPGPGPRRLRIGSVRIPLALDPPLALVLALTGYAQLESPYPDSGGPASPLVLALVAFGGVVPLLLRHSRPLAAWRLSFLMMLVAATVIRPRVTHGAPYLPTLGIVYLLCLYSLAVRCERRVTVRAMIVSTLACAVLDPPTKAFALLCAVPLLLGYIVRLRRTAKRELAEQEARHEAETAVLQERQRIARELHDVVAHHMSVIAIQAEAAPYKVADPPPELAESFADIRSSALEGLTELRRILGVLRTDPAAQTAPQPGLERLEEVVASARAGGLSVETSVTGEPPILPGGVGLSAYRILQESLSNAMRHAPGASVRVEIAYEPDVLRLLVRNGPGTRPDGDVRAGGGHGLVGMRERAAMLGGELSAGPTPDGGFLVTVALPLSPVSVPSTD
ncbi:sensor histidine kinase [Actinoallomurus rhizosphaericola]|uniref:sensor histidine kinase n=1 Tax=Actinoallomurus rhizosphaericola TaxID=2952536 RepID=UPI0020914BD5|nr:sensor histidine kinase [Actinoallomurus rhizosphaericola]MCO5993627.1 sensor histidine kinase [Actinoallomurus rhizosphaericola]